MGPDQIVHPGFCLPVQPNHYHAMKRHSLLVLLLVLGIAPIMQASAQDQEPDSLKNLMDVRINRLIHQLSLTAEQEAPVREVLLAQAEQQMKIRMSARKTNNRRDLRPRAEALQKETHAKLKELLTDEQMATYKKITKKRRDRRQGPRSKPGNGQ